MATITIAVPGEQPITHTCNKEQVKKIRQILCRVEPADKSMDAIHAACEATVIGLLAIEPMPVEEIMETIAGGKRNEFDELIGSRWILRVIHDLEEGGKIKRTKPMAEVIYQLA